MSSNPASVDDTTLLGKLVARIASDLGILIDRDIVLGRTQSDRRHRRAPAKHGVQIAFKVGFGTDDGAKHGCVMVPLADAITMACHLMMVPEEAVATRRRESDLDASLKDALLEIGNFIAGAADAVVRGLFSGHCSAASEGCQGVAEGMLPAFPYQPGQELIVARSKATIEPFPEFEMTLMLPVLEG